MEYKLYNKIQNTLINKYNIIGGNYESIKNSYKLAQKIDDMQDYNGYILLNDNLKQYKTRLEDLIKKIKEYMPIAEKIPEIFDKEQNIKKLHENEKFKSIVDTYNDQLKEISWNKERLNNEVYNFDDPNRDDLFKGSDNMDEDFKTFNQQLLLLFGAVLNNYNNIKDKSEKEQKEELIKNLDQEIIKLNELIDIANQFSSYIDKKRDNILKILKIQYKDEDINFLNNTNNVIKDNEHVKELKEEEVKIESKLDLKSIKEIEIILENTIKLFEVKDEIKKLKNFNILDKIDDLDIILTIDDIITINTTQQGGDLETRFIVNEETNKKIINLLKLYEKLYDNIDKVLDESQYLKEIKYRFNYYIAYIFLIIKQTGSKDTIFFYKYLSKQKVELYFDILNKIKNKFTNLSETNRNTIKLNKYHYIIIEKLIGLFEFIKSKFPSDTHLLDIDMCTGRVQNDLILFNHFKSILKSYIDTQEGKQITDISDSNML
jgi:hypothetical protein